MKTITLHIDDEVSSELQSYMLTKSMMGNMYGIEDEFVRKILKNLELDEDKKEITFKFSKEREELI